jgi:hypothetical protein
MLEQRGPEAPEWERLADPTIGTTTVGGVTDIGQIGQATVPEGFDLGEVSAADIAGTTVATPTDITATDIGAPTGFDLGEVTAPELAGVGGAEVERIAGRDIAGPAGVTIDPVTGQPTEAVGAVTPGAIAGPGTVTIDPVTGQPTQAVGGVTSGLIGGPGEVQIDPVTGEVAEAVGAVGPGAIAGPQGLTVDPVTGQVTEAVGGVAPGEFGGASFLGGPAMADYMNVAGVEASVTQARQDYEIALNREKARQAQVGAFGARGTVEEAGLIAAQERNIAQIRGAGYERAAQLMESDATRRQQAGLQTQQLGAQTGLAGQALEAQRRESDAARAQQAAMAGQQLGFQGQLQTQQLAQAGDIRGAE